MKRALLATVVLMLSNTGHALELRVDSEISVPSTVSLTVSEQIGNESMTFYEGDPCTPKIGDKLIVESIRNGYIVARYTNSSGYASGTTCPNRARIIATISEAKAWLDAYAKKSGDEFDETLRLMMQSRRQEEDKK